MILTAAVEFTPREYAEALQAIRSIARERYGRTLGDEFRTIVNVWITIGADEDEARQRGIQMLERYHRVPGRFEPVDEGQGFAVLVDYAHTPDSLENVLQAARPLADGRVIAVFGAGGDRDRGKRPQMGRIASELADVVIVTSDNPRSEEPQAIIDQILAGASRDVEALVDRRAAIERAVELAAPGDVVVIAGKGHEQGQEFEGGRKIPFDDVTVARDILRAVPVKTGAPRN